MCQHNIIGLQKISDKEKEQIEKLGFYRLFKWKEIQFFVKHSCDCDSFVGKLADKPKWSYEYYIAVQKDRKKEKVQQLFHFMSSENYRSKKNAYIEKLQKQDEIYKKLHFHIERYEEKMTNEIDGMGFSEEEEEQAYARMYQTINDMEKRLNELPAYKEYEKVVRELHTGENQIIFEAYMLECEKKEKKEQLCEQTLEQEKFYIHAVTEYKEILDDIRTLQNFCTEVYFGTVWNEEMSILKEKKCLLIEELDMDELACINYGEVLRIRKKMN